MKYKTKESANKARKILSCFFCCRVCCLRVLRSFFALVSSSLSFSSRVFCPTARIVFSRRFFPFFLSPALSTASKRFSPFFGSRKSAILAPPFPVGSFSRIALSESSLERTRKFSMRFCRAFLSRRSTSLSETAPAFFSPSWPPRESFLVLPIFSAPEESFSFLRLKCFVFPLSGTRIVFALSASLSIGERPTDSSSELTFFSPLSGSETDAADLFSFSKPAS